MDIFTTGAMDHLTSSEVYIADLSSEFESTLSSTADYIVAAYILNICVFSFLGNAAVLATYIYKIRKVKPLDLLTINLAVSDLLEASTGFPLSVVSSFKHGWAYGDAGCTWYGFCGFLYGTTSMMTIAAIAAMRYFKLFGAQKEDKVLFEYMWRIIPFIWIYAFIIAILPILGVSSYATEPYNISCTLNWTGSSLEDTIFIFVIVCVVYGLPLCICIVCYVCIFKQLVNRNHNVRRGFGHVETRLVKTSFAVMLCFTVAWTPYTWVSVLSSIQGESTLPVWATVIPTLCAKSSTLFNPAIYMVFNRQFREEVSTLFQCCGCRCYRVSINPSPLKWDDAVRGLLGGKRYNIYIGMNELSPEVTGDDRIKTRATPKNITTNESGITYEANRHLQTENDMELDLFSVSTKDEKSQDQHDQENRRIPSKEVPNSSQSYVDLPGAVSSRILFTSAEESEDDNVPEDDVSMDGEIACNERHIFTQVLVHAPFSENNTPTTISPLPVCDI